MPRDLILEYRREQLASDAAAIRDFADRLERMIRDLHFEAAQAEDAATGEAMVALAGDLRDAAHGPVSAMLAAHDTACDELNIEPLYQPDAGVCLALGLAIKTPLAGKQLQAAVDEVAARFKTAAE